MANTPKKKSAPRKSPARRDSRPAPTLPATLSFFDEAHSHAPLAAFATAKQLARLLDDPALDDPALRRLSDPALAGARDPARGTTWLPKASGARWPLAPDASGRSPALAGLWAHARHEHTTRPGLPATYHSALDLERALGWTPAAVNYAIKNSPATDLIREESGRIRLLPLLKYYGQQLAHWLNKNGTTNLDHLAGAGFDLDQEKAKLTIEQTQAAARENALANQRLHDRADLELRVQTEFLSPLREAQHAFLKKLERYPRLDPTGEIRADLRAILTALAAGLPATAHLLATREPVEPVNDYSI